jgi:tRNA(fMet)-specific endonuclease VapC
MSRPYLLDTDTVSYAFRDIGRVASRIKQNTPSGICISAVTLAELRFGASRKRSKRIHGLIDAFVSQVPVMPFDDTVANRFGDVAAALADAGVGIGDIDTMIAAHALDLDATLVTNNMRHFRRVKGLRVESWF